LSVIVLVYSLLLVLVLLLLFFFTINRTHFSKLRSLFQNSSHSSLCFTLAVETENGQGQNFLIFTDSKSYLQVLESVENDHPIIIIIL